MSIRLLCLAVLILALPAPASAADLFKQAGIRTHGFHFLEGARAEVGTVNPENGSSAVVLGLNSSAGTLFHPSLDLTLGFRYWSADLDAAGNSGSAGSFSDFSLHGDLNYHIAKIFGLRPYVLAGLGGHFASADVPNDSQLQDAIGGFNLGLDFGVGVATARNGLGGRFEIRKEVVDQVGNWSYTVGVGWWPGEKAQRVPAGTAAVTTAAPTSTTPSTPSTTGTPAPTAAAPSTTTGGLSYAEAAALQATIDRLRAENDALKAQAGGTAPPAGAAAGAVTAPGTPESRAAAQRGAFQRMASLSGDPGGFSETPQGCQFRSESFVNFPEGGSKLDARDQEQIRRLAVLLLMFPGSSVELQGHGDSRGSVAANQKVTTARAEVVRQELLRLGVAAGSVTAQGLGASRSVADNATADGRSANRRVSVRVSGAAPR